MTRDRAVTVAWIALAASALSIVTLPPNWVAIALAVVALVGFARDPRIGWLPAGLLVVAALPFGRGADFATLGVAGVVIRAPDPVLAIALLVPGWQLVRHRSSRPRLTPAARTFIAANAVFIGVGVMAAFAGLLAEHGLRDILRDLRWWGLYLAAPLAVLAGVRRDAVLRALLLGITAFAVVVVATAVLPVFDGALKDQALAYDRGTLRMQFGNSVLLVPATAYAAYSALRHRSAWRFAWVGLLFTAQIMSLTRISFLATAGALGLVAVIHVSRHWDPAALPALAGSVAALALTCILAFGAGIAMADLGTLPPGSTSDSGISTSEDPLHRITFGDYQSGFTQIIGSVASGGRMATYLNALQEITQSPIIGRGGGQLVRVAFANRESRTYTLGWQPGVDNAYLTIALKAGAVGVASFVGLLALTAIAAFRRGWHRLGDWYLPAIIAVGVMTMTQSFAVSGYAPYALSLLAALPFFGYAATNASAARAQQNLSRSDLRDSRTAALNS